MQLHSCFGNIRDILLSKTSIIYARIFPSEEMKPCHSIWIKVVALCPGNSTFKLGFSSAEKAKDQIENLNLYLDSELSQSLLAFLFAYRYHQAGLRMLVLMSYNKPFCDMYHGIMNLCSVLTWYGRATFLNAGK